MRITKLLILGLALMFLFGCTYASGPISAPISTDLKGPVAGFDNDASATKVGKATAQGIIVVGQGDASIKAAAENGNITKIHHVDSESMNVLGFYSEYTTIVYGE